MRKTWSALFFEPCLTLRYAARMLTSGCLSAVRLYVCAHDVTSSIVAASLV